MARPNNARSIPPGLREVTALLLGRVGDLLVATPMLRALRQRDPEARIRLVIKSYCRQAAELVPFIDEVAVLGRAQQVAANAKLAAALVGRRCDLLVDLNPSFSRTSAALAALVRAPVKLAFAKGRLESAFTDLLPAPADEEPMLDRYARMAAALEAPYEPKLEIRLNSEHERMGEELGQRAFGGRGRRILIHAGNFKKFDNRWPEEKFSALGLALQMEGVQVCWLAGPGELEPVAAIAETAGGGPIISPPSLGATAALMKRSELVVCNITGTTHLAAAAGAATFGLYAGYTNAVWRPRGEAHSGVVSSDWRSCREIPVETVLEGIRRALSAPAR